MAEPKLAPTDPADANPGRIGTDRGEIAESYKKTKLYKWVYLLTFAHDIMQSSSPQNRDITLFTLLLWFVAQGNKLAPSVLSNKPL